MLLFSPRIIPSTPQLLIFRQDRIHPLSQVSQSLVFPNQKENTGNTASQTSKQYWPTMCIGQDTFFEGCKHIIRSGEACEEAKFFKRRTAYECELKEQFAYKQVRFTGYCPQCAKCHNLHMQWTPELTQPASISCVGFAAIISTDPAEARWQAESYFAEIEECLRASGTGVQLTAREDLDRVVGELLGLRDSAATLTMQRNDYRALAAEYCRQLQMERGMLNDVLSSNGAAGVIQLTAAKAKFVRTKADRTVESLKQPILQLEADMAANPGTAATAAVPSYQQLGAELNDLKARRDHELEAERQEARREVRQELEREYEHRLQRANAGFPQQNAGFQEQNTGSSQQDTRLREVADAYEQYSSELRTAVNSQGPVFVSLQKEWHTPGAQTKLLRMVAKNNDDWKKKRDPAIKAAKAKLAQALSAAGMASSSYHGRPANPIRGGYGEDHGMSY